MIKQLTCLPLIFSTLLMVFSTSSEASFIVQTASGDVDPMAGYASSSISNDAYLHHRFQITETT